MSRAIHTTLESAIEAFETGDPVLIYDGADREHEVDLLYPAHSVDPRAVTRLRNDAGGLVFVAIPSTIADAFDLPFLHDVLDHPATEYDSVGYDTRPSFSLSVNHRDTYTGVTDEDRSTTIQALAKAARNPSTTDFAAEFRAPGHVHLLRGAAGLLAARRGHTELGLALARETENVAAVAGAEMLDDVTGRAMSPESARDYAARHELVYLDARDVFEHLA